MSTLVLLVNSNTNWAKKMSTKKFAELLKPEIVDLKIVNSVKTLDYVKYDHILPVTNIKIKEAHKANIKSLATDPASHTIFSCKKLFSEYVEKNTLQENTPRLYDENSEFDIAIIKRYDSCYGNGSKFIKNVSEINSFDKDILIQEVIPGDKEYVAHIVAINGNITYCKVYCHQMKNELSICGAGNDPLTTTLIEHTLDDIQIFEKFLIPCKYSGICCIDYKLSNNGIIKVMEINPRIGMSLLKSDTTLTHLAEMIKILIKN